MSIRILPRVQRGHGGVGTGLRGLGWQYTVKRVWLVTVTYEDGDQTQQEIVTHYEASATGYARAYARKPIASVEAHEVNPAKAQP